LFSPKKCEVRASGKYALGKIRKKEGRKKAQNGQGNRKNI